MLDSISFLRIIKTGFVNFWRNIWLSVAATMVMTITVIIFAILFLMFGITNYSVKSIQNRIDVSVYLKKGLAEDKILAFKDKLASEPQVKEVNYVSADQALEEFKTLHQGSDNITAAINVLDENPLSPTLRIKAKNLEDYPTIAQEVSSDQYSSLVDKVNFNDNRDIIDRLSKILRLIVTGGLVLVAVFSLIAILVIFNTITLTIYNRKEEVEIMRLVGATNWYIQGPFLTEAVIYSVFSTVLAGLLFLPVFGRVLPRITQFVSPEVQVFSQNIFSYPFLLLIMLATSLVLAIFSTMLAIRKYLKV